MKTRPFFGPSLEASKATLFRLVGYEIREDPRSPASAQEVLRFHQSTATEKIVSAPARSSKSWSAAPEITHAFFPELDEAACDFKAGKLVAAEADLHLWIVPPVYKLAKEWSYAREHLLDRGLVKLFGGKIETSTNAESQGNMQLTVLWPFKTRDGRACRSTLQVRSAANEDLLQAEEVKLAVVSEAADQPERIISKFLKTRCRTILYPTTPKRSGLWLYEKIARGRERPDLGIEHFQFDRFCNPTYDHARYERAKMESALTFGSPENDPDFMEQFEGQWTFAGGQVLPFRWLPDAGGLPSNVVDAAPRWISGASWFATFDYGYDDPAVCLFIALSPAGEMFVASEIYQRHLTDEDLIDRARARERDLGLHVEGWIPDPQRPVLTEGLRRRGLPLFDRAPLSTLRDRAAGYQALRSAFSVDPAVGRPRMTLLRSCVQTITELKNIRFKEGHHNEFSAVAIEGADHACFTADTLITTDRGLVPISDVKAGDYALTRAGLRRVEAAWCDGEQEVAQALFSDGRTLTVTPNHPLWSDERGWTRLDALRHDESCAVYGSAPTSTSAKRPVLGSVRLVAVSKGRARRLVYNLSVEGEHEYFAGGVLARNCDALRYFAMSRVRAKKTERDWLSDWMREQRYHAARRGAARARAERPLLGHAPAMFAEAR